MKALILGIGGQDGSYLAEILLENGWEVHGLYRRSSVNNLQRIEHLKGQVTLHQGDITDLSSVAGVLDMVRPQQIYNLADQDHVGHSYSSPGVSFDTTARAVATILHYVTNSMPENTRFFQPVSATMYEGALIPHKHNSLISPKSPYAIAKVAAYHTARYYSRLSSHPIVTGIMYNHDSPRRGEDYLLHHICRQVISNNSSAIRLGYPNLLVDIGYARDYMQDVYDLMQQGMSVEVPICSGKSYLARELCVMAGATSVEEDETYRRPNIPGPLVGSMIPLKRVLGERNRIPMEQLIEKIKGRYR